MVSPVNRLTRFWHRPPQTTAPICDRTMAERLAALVRVHHGDAPIGQQTIAVPVTIGEIDFIGVECRQLRGACAGIPFRAILRAIDGFMAVDKPTVFHAIYEVQDD